MDGAIGSGHGTKSKNTEKTSMEKYGNGIIIFEANTPPKAGAAMQRRQMCVNPKGQHDNNLAQIPAAAAAVTKDGWSTNGGTRGCKRILPGRVTRLLLAGQ